MLPYQLCLHGIHSNGVGQEPNSDVKVVNLFMEKSELMLTKLYH
jgi:hypothetical protein